MEYYLQNGKIVSESDLNPRSEWLNYAVSFRVSMWFANGTIPFLEVHIQKINKAFGLLNRNYSIEYEEKAELTRLIYRLINKNKAYMGGWLVLDLFAAETKWTCIGSVRKSPRREIPYEEQGRLAIISDEPAGEEFTGRYSILSTGLFEAREKLKIAGSRYGEIICTNRSGSVLGTPGANLFAISGNRLYTPSPETCCPDDNFRILTLMAAREQGLDTIETGNMTPADLMNMDELFTVSESTGFKWIMGIGIKRFLRKHSELIRNRVDLLLWQPRGNTSHKA
jgi:branched-subunit amino acid aminotransferase/4-amino-4-deoxychorismate lyase